jgi:predicted naringenin-chalcone synthase
MAPLVPTIVGLEVAAPPLVLEQANFFETFFKPRYAASVPDAADLFAASRVKRRHAAWDPRETFSSGSPKMRSRMEAWERVTMELGRRTFGALVKEERHRIGSLVMASCTGSAEPGPDLLLAKELGLPPTLRRTFVGHMGCHAAFNALKVGMDSLAARPDEDVLVNCTELCMLHVSDEPSKEQAVIHSLFGDASATLRLRASRSGGAQLLRSHTEVIYEASDAMTWRALDDAFQMTLSPYVPFVISESIEGYLKRLLEPAGLTRADIRHWGVHPGGPKIVQMVADRLQLTDAQQRATWHVLSEFGNCSSATILLILKELMDADRPRPGEHCVLMAFGPGLTIEGMLLRF